MSFKEFLRKILKGLFLVAVAVAFLGLGGVVTTWIYIKNVVQGEEIEVPDFYGLDLEESLQLTKGLGLELRVDDSRHVYSEVVEEGKILFQFPLPGKKIKKGRILEVTPSAGRQAKPIPSLQGETLGFSEILLQQADTKIAKISKVPSKVVAKGSVITQYPPPGVELGPREGVSVLLSEGPAPTWYVMPDFAGKHYVKVKSFLERHHFKPPVIKFKQVHEGVGPIVLRQSPRPGFPVHPEQTITLEVNKD